MKFAPSAALIDKLKRRKPGGVFADEVMSEHNAFVLGLGMGPACYLRLDGQVLVDERWWFGDSVRDATDDEAIAAIAWAFHKMGISELLALIPAPAPGSERCARCEGARLVTFGVKDVHGKETLFVCPDCSGRGWTTAARRSAETL